MMPYLILASDDDKAAALAAGGSSGQGDLIDSLEGDPLARSEIEREVKRLRKRRTSVDHIHLSRFNGTDLCQWYGRFGSGFHYPLGALMRIVHSESVKQAVGES